MGKAFPLRLFRARYRARWGGAESENAALRA